ncbi:MAG: hypothetical protein DME25_20360, partial [Verrucomicrobia bacterium]
MKRSPVVLLSAAFLAVSHLTLNAADPPPPVITNIIVQGSQKSLRLDGLYPGASNYTFLSSTALGSALTPNTNFFLAPYILNVFTNNGTNYGTNWAYEWRLTNNTAPSGFYRLQVAPMSSN